MNKKNLVVANFKMKLANKLEIENWIRNFKKSTKNFSAKKTEIILCPPTPFLFQFENLIEREKFSLGVQNCFWEDEGAYTGEVSAKMLKSIGAGYVILGHSERRKYFNEQNSEIAKKVERVLKNRMMPIICIGENVEEKKADLTMQVILKQLKEILVNVGRGNIEKTILCYEPVWAISSNNPDKIPTSNDIMEARLLIKKFLVEKYGKNIVERVKIIYGGSVDPYNVKEICLESGMGGALIGSASVKPYDFFKIVQEFEEN